MSDSVPLPEIGFKTSSYPKISEGVASMVAEEAIADPFRYILIASQYKDTVRSITITDRKVSVLASLVHSTELIPHKDYNQSATIWVNTTSVIHALLSSAASRDTDHRARFCQEKLETTDHELTIPKINQETFDSVTSRIQDDAKLHGREKVLENLKNVLLADNKHLFSAEESIDDIASGHGLTALESVHLAGGMVIHAVGAQNNLPILKND